MSCLEVRNVFRKWPASPSSIISEKHPFSRKSYLNSIHGKIIRIGGFSSENVIVKSS